MKHIIKRALTLVLALSVVCAMSITSFAADKNLSVGDNDNHSYQVFQIMTGDVNGNEASSKISNAKWGSSATKSGEVSETDLNVIKDLSDAAAIAEYVNPSKPLNGILDKDNPMEVATGYYLVKDLGVKNGESYETPESDALSLYVIQVVGKTEVNPKRDVPSVEKKVKDTSDTTGTTTGWQDSADYDLGDDVPFQLTAKLPSDETAFAGYKAYKVQFNDTLSAGLSLNRDSIQVMLGTKNVTENFTYTATTKGFALACSDVKAEAVGAKAGDEFVVTYTAKLTGENVVYGGNGNPNTVSLTYSNNPNSTGAGNPGDEGNTPEDKVVVFTYKTVVDKTDEDREPLKGAGFTLYKKVGNTWVAVGEEVKGEEMTQFVWKGVDDGDYKLVETTTPDGFNTMKDQFFSVVAEHDTASDDPKIISLNGDPADGSIITFTTLTNKEGIETEVINKSGAVLPSTGGIGTTIFYVLGAILVLGAAILLITRRRVNAAK